MKGLYFYKLLSPYQEDITKECKLTINEIDHNFINLKNTDIKEIKFDEETGLLRLFQINGDEFVTKIDLSHFTKDFNVEWDNENSALIFTYDGKTIKIDEFASAVLDNSIEKIVQEIISQTITDNTLLGVGIGSSPLRVNPLETAGTYRAVECVINKIEGETLPDADNVKKGDRFLTYEHLNLYGKLYNFETVKKINAELKNGWRVPTKEDWDNMLNAIELCDEDKNHQNDICNQEVGRFAGIFLKYPNCWKTIDNNATNNNDLSINPSSVKGVDKYGFSVLPAGYGDSFQSFAYMGERSEFWTLTEKASTDIFTKRFFYNKASIVQMASSPQSLCSLRLVKDYDGNNFLGVETINGVTYKTVLMPSENSKHGFTIWLASNVAFEDEHYPSFSPNNGNIIADKTAYYINEWDGVNWLKKQLIDGDSIVIKKGSDDYVNAKYQLIDGILINTQKEMKDEMLSLIASLNSEYICKEGEYINCISQNNGLISASTKTLIKQDDKILTFSNEGVFSTLDLLEEKDNLSQPIKRQYKLVDKNKEIIGQPIIIDKNMTNETYVSSDIQVVGGPLSSFVFDTTPIIKAGTNIQELLYSLFCKELYPQNPKFNEGLVSSTIESPIFDIYYTNTNNVIDNEAYVEAGTMIDINAIYAQNVTNLIAPSTWTGFDYGYSLENNNIKDGVGNPPNLINTPFEQKSKYYLQRKFYGFDNKVNNQIAKENSDYTQVYVPKLVNLTVADGVNSIISEVSGATYSTIFKGDNLNYYYCSNLGNTNDKNYVVGYTHTKTTNVPTNQYKITINGARFSYLGAVELTNFEITSDFIRSLSKTALTKEETTSLNAPKGNKSIIIAYPKIWGVLKSVKDNNAFGALLTNEFNKYECNVEGLNGYEAIPYYVYVYTSKIVLGAINYQIEIK